MNEEENQAFKILRFYNSEDYGTEELKKHIKIIVNLIEKQQKEIEYIKEYINSPEFLDWNLGFKLIDELEYRKDRINKLLGE